MDGTVWAVNGADTTTVFETEYATTPEAIEIGMMYRRSTPPNRAMLFFMPGGDQPRSFWMKNTLVSLDIIYINAMNDVVSIQANAEPRSMKSLPSGGGRILCIGSTRVVKRQRKELPWVQRSTGV
jgi:uncharacterized membrane protein (UPF0127 family)